MLGCFEVGESREVSSYEMVIFFRLLIFWNEMEFDIGFL